MYKQVKTIKIYKRIDQRIRQLNDNPVGHILQFFHNAKSRTTTPTRFKKVEENIFIRLQYELQNAN